MVCIGLSSADKQQLGCILTFLCKFDPSTVINENPYFTPFGMHLHASGLEII